MATEDRTSDAGRELADARTRIVRHLQAARDLSENDDVRYHIREAEQLARVIYR